MIKKNDETSFFRWHAIVIEGNCVESILKAFKEVATIKGKPVMILAKTFKGAGRSLNEVHILNVILMKILLYYCVLHELHKYHYIITPPL